MLRNRLHHSPSPGLTLRAAFEVWNRRCGEGDTKPPKRISLNEKLSQIHEHWQPKITAELNGQYVKLVKFKDEFIWHHHENEDELFLVLKGKLRIEFRDGTVDLDEGEMVVVPRGVEHRPVAGEEVHVMLFEPASTLNTGNVTNERTVRRLGRI